MVGREEEIDIINRLCRSNKSELLAVTGRRRVGKTYLITESLKDNIVFEFTGSKNGTTSAQLKKFNLALKKHFPQQDQRAKVKDWIDAFDKLSTMIASIPVKKSKQRVLFFDEFPWIATNKSNFLSEFEYWWNGFAVKEKVMVVISGSAASWLIEHVVNNKDGLYNRLSHHIMLQPFSLYETKKFLLSKGIKLESYDIAQLYMTTGGIPHYLNAFQKGQAVIQTINSLCFRKSGLLYNEFKNLYASLFAQPENYLAVVKALSSKWKGMTRQEIIKATSIADGGTLSTVLDALEECSFIIRIQPYGSKTREVVYRIVDEFTIFYYSFMAQAKAYSAGEFRSDAKYQSWLGYAFENLCIRHQHAIAYILGISGVQRNVCSFIEKGSAQKKGFQIDMLIDRNDNCINLFELKFVNSKLEIDKKIAEQLNMRKAHFIKNAGPQKNVFSTVITTFGIKSNSYALQCVDNEIKLEQMIKYKSALK
jgi:uncharacterized protein